jgi:hypothetical protein
MATTGFYRIGVGFYRIIAGFYRLWIGFYRVLPHITASYRINFFARQAELGTNMGRENHGDTKAQSQAVLDSEVRSQNVGRAGREVVKS